VDNQAVELPYMVSRKLEGSDATHHPDRLRLVGELGRMAAKLHTVRTHGYGEVFDWSSNQLSHCATWGDYLDGVLNAPARMAMLARERMLTGEQLDAMHEVLEEMRRWRKPPALHHGDLRLKNLVVDDESGQVIALIDWDEALSAPAPYWDLSIALHDLNDDEKESFLDGYGMTPRSYAQALRFVRALNTLNYGNAVEELRRGKARERMAWYRARMQGQFDLFAHA
jgi:hygromycin-B 4-O-kinase